MLNQDEPAHHYRPGYNPEFVRRVNERRREERAKAAIATRAEQRERERKAEEAAARALVAATGQRVESVAAAITQDNDRSPLERALAKTGSGNAAIRAGALEIVKIMADAYGVLPSDITGASTKRDILKVRVATVLKVREHFPKMSLVQLGKVFNRDHTSILYLLRKHGGADLAVDLAKPTHRMGMRIPHNTWQHLSAMAEETGRPLASLCVSLLEAIVEDELANAAGRYLRAIPSPKQEGQPR